MFHPRIAFYSHLLFFLLCLLYTITYVLFPVATIVSAMGFTSTNWLSTLHSIHSTSWYKEDELTYSKQKNTRPQWSSICVCFASHSRICSQGKYHILLVSCFPFMMGSQCLKLLESERKLFLKDVKVARITCSNHIAAWSVTDWKGKNMLVQIIWK
jgi:hypothetical protein